MRVRSVSLHNIRRYAELSVELPPGVILISGANGAGKTTLLEAMYLALTGTSFRPGNTTNAVIRHEADSASIHLVVEGDEREVELDVALSRTGRIKRRLNDTPIGARQMIGLNTAVTVFTPDDLELSKGPAELRRRYLDDIAGFLVPRVAACQSEYERVVRHRNALLKGGTDPHSQAVFDEQLCVAGAEVTRARLGLLSRISERIERSYAHISARPEPAYLEYRSDWLPEHARTVEEIHAALQHSIEEKRIQELQRGVTLVGPHRDDVLGWIGNTSVRHESSQGEQRSFALALRLAGHGFLAEHLGSDPILLLDDVFSELDAERSERLLSELSSPQTLVTRAGNPSVEVPYDAKLLVADGRLEWA